MEEKLVKRNLKLLMHIGNIIKGLILSSLCKIVLKISLLGISCFSQTNFTSGNFPYLWGGTYSASERAITATEKASEVLNGSYVLCRVGIPITLRKL